MLTIPSQTLWYGCNKTGTLAETCTLLSKPLKNPNESAQCPDFLMICLQNVLTASLA